MQNNGIGIDEEEEDNKNGKSSSSKPDNINLKDSQVDGISRTELVRLIIQSLQHMGYNRAAALLEQDSGILLQAGEITEFVKCVLEGRWAEVDKLLPYLGIQGPNAEKMRFLIYSQKFLELLEARKVKEALNVLRHELTPLNQSQEKLHRLTSLIMCTDVADLKRKAEWDGSAGESRRALLRSIREYVSSTVMLPDHRLGELIKQAMSWQTAKCLYHNSPTYTTNLFEDHECSPDMIPRETVQILEKHSDEVWYIKFSHNGKMLASASKDATVILWEIDNGVNVSATFIRSLLGHTQPVSFVSWSPDDLMLLSCSNDYTVRLWSVDDGSCIRIFKHHSDSVTACAWLPDGKHFVSGGNDKNIYLSHVDGRALNHFVAGRVNDLAVSHDGKKFVAVCQEKKIRIETLDKSERPIMLDEQNPLTSMELSEDSRYLLVNLSSTSLTEIHLWDLVTQRIVQSFRAHNQKRFVIRSCFGGTSQAFVLSGSEDKNVYVWRRETGNLLEVLQGHTGTANCVSWSPTNPYLFASASDDRTIRLWACQPPNNYLNNNNSNNNNNHSHHHGYPNGSPVQNST